MDIVTDVYVPADKTMEKRIVNLELQNIASYGYAMQARELFYGSRLLLMQYGREFNRMNYSQIKRVYSIWIMTNPPEYRVNTICSAQMKKEYLQGNVERDTAEGIMTVVEMNLGKPEECTGVLRMLAVVLSNELNAKEKKRILEEEFQMNFTKKEEEAVEDMCDLADAIEKEARNEGMTRILLMLLKDRLKELSEEVVRAVKQSSVEKLEELALKVYSVTNETEVLHILNA